MSSAVEGTVYRARYRSSVIADPFDFPEEADFKELTKLYFRPQLGGGAWLSTGTMSLGKTTFMYQFVVTGTPTFTFTLLPMVGKEETGRILTVSAKNEKQVGLFARWGPSGGLLIMFI